MTLKNDAGKNVEFYVKMNGYLKGSEVYKRMMRSAELLKKESQSSVSDVSSESMDGGEQHCRETEEQAEVHSENEAFFEKTVEKSLVERILSWFST